MAGNQMLYFQKDPLEKGMATHSSICLENSMDRESWGGYSPRNCKELDTTEGLTLSHFCFHVRFFRHINALVGGRGHHVSDCLSTVREILLNGGFPGEAVQ